MEIGDHYVIANSIINPSSFDQPFLELTREHKGGYFLLRCIFASNKALGSNNTNFVLIKPHALEPQFSIEKSVTKLDAD